MLTLLGFHSIILRKGDEDLKEEYGDGSADIISYCPQVNKLVIIDCTIGTNISKKVDTMINLVNNIKKSLIFVPLIITNKLIAPETIKTANLNGIIVLENTGIENIINLLNEHDCNNARKTFLNSLDMLSNIDYHTDSY